jgi:tRNA threonylcarbamoyladenosine biosynthesis protein TsaE
MVMPRRRPALDLISHSPDQTRRIGFHLGRLSQPGDVYLLSGEVGAGKTTFTQGFASGLNVKGYVQSPTFALAAEHQGRMADGRPVQLFHLDFYRLEEAADLETFGYEDYLDAPDGIVVIEWPERIMLDLPEGYLAIVFEYLAHAKRRLVFRPHGARFVELIDMLRTEVFGVQRRSPAPGDR